MNNLETKIDEVEIVLCRPKSGLRGFASLVLSDSIFLNDIAIYTRLDGSLRLVFPAKTLPNGNIVRLFYPITKDMGNLLTHAVENKYNEIMDYSSKEGPNGR